MSTVGLERASARRPGSALPSARSAPAASAESSSGSMFSRSSAFSAPRQHLAGVQAARARQRVRPAARRRCWRLRRGSRRVAPVCSAIQLREAPAAARLRMLRGGVAEQDRLALAAEQRRRRSPWRRRWRCRLRPAPRRPCSAAIAAAMSASACDPAARRDGRCACRSASASRRRRAWTLIDLGARARRLAQALREQRMVLAQERADDQRALQLSTAKRSTCRASAARRRPARSRRGAGGGRCSRCRGRARAWPADAVPRRVLCGLPARRCSARRARA